MKPSTILALGLALCMACSSRNKTGLIENDSTDKTDSVVLEDQPVAPIPTAVIQEPPRKGQLVEEKGEMIFLSENEYAFISDPYDFSLSDSAIEGLLGEGAKTEVEEFEGGEDYDAYTYSTTTYGDTKISYYSYPGKHSASISTPLLPLKYGFKIGMSKNDFLTAMKYESADASKANVYRLTEDYGSINFSFQADTLYHIHVFYEEGD